MDRPALNGFEIIEQLEKEFGLPAYPVNWSGSGCVSDVTDMLCLLICTALAPPGTISTTLCVVLLLALCRPIGSGDRFCGVYHRPTNKVCGARMAEGRAQSAALPFHAGEVPSASASVDGHSSSTCA